MSERFVDKARLLSNLTDILLQTPRTDGKVEVLIETPESTTRGVLNDSGSSSIEGTTIIHGNEDLTRFLTRRYTSQIPETKEE